jgi:putative cofactor-binding repeat protein
VGVTINNNIITDCTKLRDGSGHGILLEFPGFTAVSIRGNTIRNTDASGAYVQGVDSLIEGNVFENIGAEAVYVVDSATIRDCNVKNTGVVGGAAAINCYGNAVYRVYGCKLTGVRQPKAILSATEISDTMIKMVDDDGNPRTGADVIASDYLTRLVNCQLDGYISIEQNNAFVQGVTLNCGQQWQPAIRVFGNGVIITGCNINHTYSKDAIAEQSGYNHNLFANNIVNRPITTVGAQSVSVNNINTTVTA